MARGAPVAANRTRALVSVIFNFGIKKSYLPDEFVNPCRNVDRPGGKEKSRDRVLTRVELKKLWKELESIEEPVASIYRLTLLTAQRGGEVKAMRWSELEGDIWTIPGEKAKNGQEHKVPLSRAVRAILERLREENEDPVWVFPSPVGNRHIQWLGKANVRLQKATGFQFRPHDLRRTAATWMSRRGIDDVIIAKILNHTWADRQVTSVYNRWQKLPEMRQALERWAAELHRAVTSEPAKVVRLN